MGTRIGYRGWLEISLISKHRGNLHSPFQIRFHQHEAKKLSFDQAARYTVLSRRDSWFLEGNTPELDIFKGFISSTFAQLQQLVPEQSHLPAFHQKFFHTRHYRI